MKILHVIADLDLTKGGPSAACFGLARLMARRGYQVRIVTTDRGYILDRDSRPNELQIDALPASPPAFFGTSWAMRRRLREVVPDVDVVHLHSLYLFHDCVAARYCRRFRKPYIVRPHGTLDPYIYRRHRWRKAIAETLFQNDVLRRAAGLHYTTSEEWQLARPYALNTRGCVVPNGIDLGAFSDLPSRSALRSCYPEIGDRKVVLFLGRLSFKKGVDIVVNAFARVARERDDLFLVIAGPDEGVRASAEALIRSHDIAAQCVFTGMVTGSDKQTVLGGSDIFVLPSQSENFGISVVEAAASGIPVIISDRVNLWREFRDAEAGLVAPPSETEFAAHLKFLIDHPAAAREMARRGADLARRRFSWDALGPQYEQMYAMAARDRALPELG